MFASKHTRVEIPSKSISTLLKDLRFPASPHFFHDKVFPAKYYKVGKGLQKVVHSASKTKKEIRTTSFKRSIIFQQLSTIILQYSGFLENSLLHCLHCWNLEIRLVKKVLILLLAKQTVVFLMGDFFDETEMYDTNDKRSLHLSES